MRFSEARQRAEVMNGNEKSFHRREGLKQERNGTRGDGNKSGL